MPGVIPIVSSPAHTGHRPAVEVQCGRQIRAYDSVERIDTIRDALGGLPGAAFSEADATSDAVVERVHSGELVAFLRGAWESGPPPTDDLQLKFADTFLHRGLRGSDGPVASTAGDFGRYCFDTITGIGPDTYAAARASVDTAITAAGWLGAEKLAVGLCRPPGHHVSGDVFGGGCYLNNAATAAQWLLDAGRSRVAILDLDFHHGNGTQKIFYERSDVLYVSLHGDPASWYPYFTGYDDECGVGDGTGFTLNLLLPKNCSGPEYRVILQEALAAIMDAGCDALVVSLGLDTAKGDASGDAQLVASDYTKIGASVAALGLDTVALLEGGYMMSTIGENVAAWVSGAAGVSV